MSSRARSARSGRSLAKRAEPATRPANPLRIIGGRLRGRRIQYSGDPRTRPMKDRVRQAIFNMLGPAVEGKHALDIFAGTGALGLEAISRGAARATFLERHFPSAELIRRNASELGVAQQCEVIAADAFHWVQKQLPSGEPWLVFVSPPYELYTQRRDDMLALIDSLRVHARPGSVLVVETREDFDVDQLPQAEYWHVRHYRPALVAILETAEPLGGA
jgi:16S rRNA (guanine966-N2)-methyltransferase